MELKYSCDECSNVVILDQDYLDYLGYKNGDPLPEPQCKCLNMLTFVE